MKVEIKTIRECCNQREDLLPVENSPRFQGLVPAFVFCKHCGRHWEADSFRDAAGGSDWEYKRMKAPWDKP